MKWTPNATMELRHSRLNQTKSSEFNDSPHPIQLTPHIQSHHNPTNPIGPSIRTHPTPAKPLIQTKPIPSHASQSISPCHSSNTSQPSHSMFPIPIHHHPHPSPIPANPLLPSKPKSHSSPRPSHRPLFLNPLIRSHKCHTHDSPQIKSS